MLALTIIAIVLIRVLTEDASASQNSRSVKLSVRIAEPTAASDGLMLELCKHKANQDKPQCQKPKFKLTAAAKNNILLQQQNNGDTDEEAEAEAEAAKQLERLVSELGADSSEEIMVALSNQLTSSQLEAVMGDKLVPKMLPNDKEKVVVLIKD